MLTDTHCHIHDSEFYDKRGREEAYARAVAADVTTLLCVGTSEKSSVEAIQFAHGHSGAYAAIGVHPHDAQAGWNVIERVAREEAVKGERKLVAIGEIGLDYFYDNSPRNQQREALEAQLQIALDYALPVVFHVREAFDDFWSVLDNFPHVHGVLHSFTDTQANLEKGFKRGLYVGVNGISTFTKDSAQREMYASIPVERMLLETDAPFLAPMSRRGHTNQPAFIGEIAEFHAGLRNMPSDELAQVTTQNAKKLFSL